MSKRVTVAVMSFLLIAVFMVFVCGAQEEKKVELKVKLPKPLFIGTPTAMRGVNLDPINKDKKRGAFMVPEGTVLLSAKKTVTSSDSAPVVGSLDQITDADKEGSDGSFVELGPGKQWVQIDLGSANNIYAIIIWHYHSMARVYRDVIVQVADDPDFITNVRTIFNNDNDNTAGMGVGKEYEYVETSDGVLIDGKGQKARYVRLYSNGSTASEMNHYIEVEIFGKAAK
ncbi:MAG: hypothetical protein PHR77_05280 [Kiritimatiellae bacterium]|nr:hypothetical protein [Kiritimatiellia bacterium]MDD5522124.1 hypothetical protein [Kiritimatiellia bacterium]